MKTWSIFINALQKLIVFGCLNGDTWQVIVTWQRLLQNNSTYSAATYYLNKILKFGHVLQVPCGILCDVLRKSWSLWQKLQTMAPCTLHQSEFQIGMWSCSYPAPVVLNVQLWEVVIYVAWELEQSSEVHVTGSWATSPQLTLLFRTQAGMMVSDNNTNLGHCSQVILLYLIDDMLYEPL